MISNHKLNHMIRKAMINFTDLISIQFLDKTNLRKKIKNGVDKRKDDFPVFDVQNL